jgi:hypothetical protein
MHSFCGAVQSSAERLKIQKVDAYAGRNMMRRKGLVGGGLVGVFACWAVLAPAPLGVCQDQPGRAEVRAVMGSASYSTSGGQAMALRPGAVLAEGLVIQSGPGSAVDLWLGQSAGTVRLTQSTTLALEKLPTSDDAPENTIQIRLNLLDGTILGFNNNLTTASRYEVKVSNGIVAVGGNKFRINSRGFLVLLSGTLLFAHVPAGGEPVAHTLKAPPAVYFSPIENAVRRAPLTLEEEVFRQCKPKLRSP